MSYYSKHGEKCFSLMSLYVKDERDKRIEVEGDYFFPSHCVFHG